MEDILYVKVEQNMVVQKKTLTYERHCHFVLPESEYSKKTE